MIYDKFEVVKSVAYRVDSLPFLIQGQIYKIVGNDNEFHWQASHRSDVEQDGGGYSSIEDAESDLEYYVEGIDIDNIRGLN